MKKFWEHKAYSFKEAEEFDDRYYMLETPQERLSDVQLCRDMYIRLKGLTGEGRKGLRRVIKVIKQK